MCLKSAITLFRTARRSVPRYSSRSRYSAAILSSRTSTLAILLRSNVQDDGSDTLLNVRLLLLSNRETFAFGFLMWTVDGDTSSSDLFR